ncbi:hypothetical protein FisN_2Lh394 [Fistulifera solaris]|uniref:Uncharacterized protein n=1 Tax=Fistulifera solaris TaxID=1519565 RepID=A0A1Z5JPB0_FISSO|nr:hypothetical protein FisN_2Lh394 [Fistulifera solaris]|eukprot:GAX15875.1 hypothetical protein FisN_2Lh394 [Fistulifera solaris]
MLHTSHIVNDENVTELNKTTSAITKDSSLTVHKTPAGTKSRRAFGDISNKRPQKHLEREGDDIAWKSAAAPRTPAAAMTKKSSKKSSKKTSVRLFPNPDTKRGVTFAEEKVESSKIPSTLHTAVSEKNETLETSACEDDDNYDEPEKPLGRTYQQQWENGDHDDDETVLSLEGVYDIAKRWKEFDEKINSLQPSYEEQFQQHIADFDRELEEFTKQEASCVDTFPSPDESALLSFLNELEDDLDIFAADDSSAPTNLEISFG